MKREYALTLTETHFLTLSRMEMAAGAAYREQSTDAGRPQSPNDHQVVRGSVEARVAILHTQARVSRRLDGEAGGRLVRAQLRRASAVSSCRAHQRTSQQ